MTSYAEMTSRGSFNEATRGDSKAEAARKQAARLERTIARRREAMAWVAEHMPEAVHRYDSFAAYSLIRNDRDRVPRSVAAVKRRMLRDDPKACELIKEMEAERKGEAHG